VIPGIWIADCESLHAPFFPDDKSTIRISLDTYDKQWNPERCYKIYSDGKTSIHWLHRWVDDPAIINKKQLAEFLNYFVEIWKVAKNMNGKMMVNCGSGINRSAFVIGCIMALKGYNYDEIIGLLTKANEKRGISVLWSIGFRQIIFSLCASVKEMYTTKCSEIRTLPFEDNSKQQQSNQHQDDDLESKIFDLTLKKINALPEGQWIQVATGRDEKYIANMVSNRLKPESIYGSRISKVI
jgi:hypothetical protein